MLKNYLKIAVRNLIKQKAYSFINIFGLVIGMTACLLIFQYVLFEKSYDGFHKDANNIYRIRNDRYYKSGHDISVGCNSRLGPVLKEEIPEVIDFARVRTHSTFVKFTDRIFKENKILWVDASFLNIFSFSVIDGNSDQALRESYSAAITESTAKKYFGDLNAIGKTLNMDGADFKIMAILKDVPANSHIKFDILLSFITQINDNFCWTCNNTITYIRTNQGTKSADLESKLPSIVKKLHDPIKEGFNRAYFLQPLKSIHLYSDFRFELEKNGDYRIVYFLTLIAILILIIAWINYINLATSKAAIRAKEVCIRKVCGADFHHLVWHFLFESLFLNLIAVILALGLYETILPLFNVFVGLPIVFSLWNSYEFWMITTGITIIGAFLAGFYPAFILSSLSPINTIKKYFGNTSRDTFLRKGMTIFQFSISTSLIIAIIIVFEQMSFIRNKDLGINIDQTLVVNLPSASYDTKSTFVNSLQSYSFIKDVAFAYVVPGQENADVSGGVRPANEPIEAGKQVYFNYISKNFIDFFAIKLVCGRQFFEGELKSSLDNSTESILLNESAIKAFGFYKPEEALNKTIVGDNRNIGRVIGVIGDYHQQSLTYRINPAIYYGMKNGRYYFIKFNTAKLDETLALINDKFKSVFPQQSLEFFFLDEFFNRQYQSDQKFGTTLGLFALLAIFIACMGLFGLTSFMMEKRQKEIGVRKVLGSSEFGIIVSLSKEFLKWVLMANTISWPIAYYFMSKWLQNFAYRIDINLWVFVLSAIIALTIAIITMSIHIIRAARVNPVDSLRYE